MFKSEKVHVIIAAGDEDPRLNPLTRALTGTAVPKQFALIAGDSSLLQRTVASYAAVVPPENMVVVVPSAYEGLARQQLRRWKGIGILARTLNRGPAVDTLLALGRVVARSPNVRVMVAPAQHFVAEGALLAQALAAAPVDAALAAVILAGAASASLYGADDGDTLIVPGRRLAGGVRVVGRFVDRLSPPMSIKLRSKGALWDTSAFTARAGDLWRLGARKFPAEATMIANLWSGRTATLNSVEAVFRHMPTGKTDRTLWQDPKDLAVLAVHGAGWSAWNSPEQVMDSIGDSPQLERLLSRIYRRQQASETVRVVQHMV
jgi:mannose-1-phosphate guanylyltransferase